MAQIIRKAGRIYCRTETDYPPEIVKTIKRAGYSVSTDQRKKHTKATGENGGTKK